MSVTIYTTSQYDPTRFVDALATQGAGEGVAVRLGVFGTDAQLDLLGSE